MNGEFWYLFIIVFAAFALKILAGFGNAMVVNGGFSFLKENRFTTPVELVWNIPANAWMAWRDRKRIDFVRIAPFCVLTAVGDVLGTWFLGIGEDAVLKTILGVMLMALAAEMLFNRRSFTPNVFIGLAVAVLSGIATGLFGIGALIAAWFSRTSADKESYRSNIGVIFLVDNLVRTIAYSVSGLINANTLMVSAELLPAVILGLIAGRLADRRLDAAAVRRLVVVLLLATGAAMAAKYGAVLAKPLLR